MTKQVRFISISLIVASGFAGGFGYGRLFGPKSGTEKAADERKILYWVDPMHPAYKSDKPGIAPDCGMKLVPVYKGEEHASAHESGAPDGLPPGTIRISPEKRELIGVRFGEAEFTSADETLRAVGKVSIDETHVVRVHPRVEGWIERVQVDFNGAEVHAGQPLLTLYSPEMLASEKEYLLALKARDLMAHSTLQSAVMNTGSMVEASRKRLELWSLDQAQIEELERNGKPTESITIASPANGFVTSRNAFAGQKITPETELYTITDLSHIWVMADVFENDIPKIRLGQSGVIHMPYDGGSEFVARVNYIQPQVDPQTRTVKVRLDAPNPGMRLKPEMFVDVAFHLAGERQLTVPVDAVLNAGQKQTVFVDRGNGNLEPREVREGGQLGDRVVILSGLRAGERIVTSANFLIDSESQLKSAISGISGHQGHEHD
jgi:Cu(I)/Ag(I) efflux system membrane fusion protein